MISRLFLLSGTDLALTDSVSVHHPSIADILRINNGILCEECYWGYVSALLSDPYDYMVYLDDKKIDYESVSPFFVFTLRWFDAVEEKIRDTGSTSLFFLQEALAFFFGVRDYDIVTISGTPFLIDRNDETWCMNEKAFQIATDFIFQFNCLERKDKIHPATPGAKRMLIEDARSEQKRRLRSKEPPKQEEHIASALATVLAGGAGTITPDNFMHTCIYQLLSTSRSVQRQMVVQSMLNGIYTGMMKADKLSDEDMRWV